MQIRMQEEQGEIEKLRFRRDDTITREQSMVMLYRYAQKHGLGFTGAWYFPLTAADAGDVSDWADEAVHWVAMHAKTQDFSEQLLPKAVVTRRELGKATTAYINGVMRWSALSLDAEGNPYTATFEMTRVAD